MNIQWYGHRCIRLEAKEGSVLIDPFGKESGLRGPKINDDLILISPYIAPAGVLEQVPGESLLIHGPGEYERKGIAVLGVQSYQDTQKGAELGLCTLYTVVADEMSVCHLGALGQDTLTAEQIEAIGEPDILIIPVSGQGALDAKAAAELCNQIEPKIIIPVGFQENADAFVKVLGLPAEKVSTLRIAKKQLPADKTLLYLLES